MQQTRHELRQVHTALLGLLALAVLCKMLKLFGIHLIRARGKHPIRPAAQPRSLPIPAPPKPRTRRKPHRLSVRQSVLLDALAAVTIGLGFPAKAAPQAATPPIAIPPDPEPDPIPMARRVSATLPSQPQARRNPCLAPPRSSPLHQRPPPREKTRFQNAAQPRPTRSDVATNAATLPSVRRPSPAPTPRVGTRP